MQISGVQTRAAKAGTPPDCGPVKEEGCGPSSFPWAGGGTWHTVHATQMLADCVNALLAISKVPFHYILRFVYLCKKNQKAFYHKSILLEIKESLFKCQETNKQEGSFAMAGG